jgi:hypothetical protein
VEETLIAERRLTMSKRVGYLLSLALIAVALVISPLTTQAQNKKRAEVKKRLVLHKDRVAEWVAPEAKNLPNLQKLLGEYGLTTDNPDRLAGWLNQALPKKGQQARSVTVDWIEELTDADGRAYWHVNGFSAGQPEEFWLYLKGGEFTITDGADGIIRYQVVEPNAQVPGLNQQYHVYPLAGCYCDDGTTAGCSLDDCDNIRTCGDHHSCANTAVDHSVVYYTGP